MYSWHPPEWGPNLFQPFPHRVHCTFNTGLYPWAELVRPTCFLHIHPCGQSHCILLSTSPTPMGWTPGHFSSASKQLNITLPVNYGVCRCPASSATASLSCSLCTSYLSRKSCHSIATWSCSSLYLSGDSLDTSFCHIDINQGWEFINARNALYAASLGSRCWFLYIISTSSGCLSPSSLEHPSATSLPGRQLFILIEPLP